MITITKKDIARINFSLRYLFASKEDNDDLKHYCQICIYETILMTDPSSDSLFRITDFYERELTGIVLRTVIKWLNRSKFINGINK